jgi:repressor LexA
MALTDIQAQVLALLEARMNDCSPSPAELARELGVHITTFIQHMKALERKGYLQLESRGVGKAPAIRLLHRPEALGVPIIGDIAAGSLQEAFAYPEGYLNIPNRPDYFALRVRGQSMADLIQEGDIVLLKKSQPKSGDICAVRVDNSEVTLKYLDLSPGRKHARLRAHNPAFDTLTVSRAHIQVDGVFSALLRGDIIDILEDSVT